MSYILDALRKSDQQRQQGMAPTLSAAPRLTAPTAESRRRNWASTALAAGALLAVGVAIGGWRPWLAAPAIPAPPAVPAAPTAMAVALPPPAAAATPAVAPAIPAATETVASPPPLPAMPASPPDRKPAKPNRSNVDTPPPTLPPLAITAHAYAQAPGDRVIVINRRPLREGDEVEPGIRVERITEDGVVLNAHGRRIVRGLN